MRTSVSGQRESFKHICRSAADQVLAAPAKEDEGGAPAAVFGVVQGEGDDLRVPGKDGVDRSAHVAHALAMNDAHLENRALLAGSQVVRHQIFDLVGSEVMQIEHTVNRKLDRFVHLLERFDSLRVRLLRYTINIAIRQADLADAALIAEFNLRLARETENLLLEPARVAAGVAAILRDPAKGLYFLAEMEGQVAGQVMITYEWSDWRNGNFWWLQSVYVRAEVRRRGVFRALFDHLVRLARNSREVAGIRLYMHADNRTARNSYQRLGMSHTKYEVFEMGWAGEPAQSPSVPAA